MTLDRQAVMAALNLAAEAAEAAPEDYASTAFEHVLIAALGTGGRASPTSPGAEMQSGNPGADVTADSTDWPEADGVANGSRAEQTVWAVWRLTNEGIPATNEAVRERIRTELSIQPQNSNNTSRTLGDLAPQYLLREDNPNGAGFVYRPSRHARLIFDQ